MSTRSEQLLHRKWKFKSVCSNNIARRPNQHARRALGLTMSMNPGNYSFDSLVASVQQEAVERADAYESVRRSSDYQAELLFLRKTVLHLLQSITLCNIAASRWTTFHEQYLLPRYVDDIVEAAITAQLAIENGALNPARRELRHMLEVAVNIAYVDEVRGNESFDDRIKYYRSKAVNKSNVEHVFDLPLRLLGDQRTSFAIAVRDAWVKGSNYVHLTKRRIDEKLTLRKQGVSLGFETIDMLKQAVADVHEACSMVMILIFETIGPSFTGDIFVDGKLDKMDDWAFHANGYMAAVDSSFDYKHERQGRLREISERRNGRIRFLVPVSED